MPAAGSYATCAAIASASSNATLGDQDASDELVATVGPTVQRHLTGEIS
jgi:hypothetical protein